MQAPVKSAESVREANSLHQGLITTIRYVVITPVRNEAEFLPLLIDSLVRQTIKPQQWVVVDDGSSDGTAEIAADAARVHSWISVVRRADRGNREPGRGVIQAFSEGYLQLRGEWDI